MGGVICVRLNIYHIVIYYQATHGRAPFLLKSPSIRGLMGNDGYI